MVRGCAQLILNPISGRGIGLKWQDWIVSHFQSAGFAPTVHVTQGKDDAKRIAAQIDEECPLVVCIGGDGTLNEIVNGLRADVPIAVVPLGGANVVAQELGLPVDIAGACVAATTGEPRRWDVGVANGRRFLLMAGMGWDAYVVHRVHRRRRGPVTKLSYALGGLEGFRWYEFPRIQLVIDDEIETWGYVVVAGNAHKYGGPGELTSLAKPDDGLLDVVVWQKRRRLELLRLLGWTFSGRLHLAPGVEYYRCRRLVATSIEPVPCQVDGDPAGYLPRELVVQPAAVRLVGPRRG